MSCSEGGDAEEALRKEFKAGPDGVYRKHQGELLYLTRKRANPHRCNNRLEDVIQALFEGNPLLTARQYPRHIHYHSCRLWALHNHSACISFVAPVTL